MVVMAGILVCTTLSACGGPEEESNNMPGVLAQANQKIVDMQKQIDELTGERNTLRGEVNVAKAMLAMASVGQREAQRTALSPNDDRLWTCVSADTTKTVGRFTPAKFDPNQKLVIELDKENGPKGVIVCPARGSLSEFRPGSSFICPQVGDGPVVCSLPN